MSNLSRRDMLKTSIASMIPAVGVTVVNKPMPKVPMATRKRRAIADLSTSVAINDNGVYLTTVTMKDAEVRHGLPESVWRYAFVQKTQSQR